MANSEYIKKGGGSFATAFALDAPLDQFADIINYTRVHMNRSNGVQPGMALLLDDEIMRIETVGNMSVTVKRGCADTVPAAHPTDALGWIFDNSTLGTDGTERSGGEIVGVKVAPFTTASAMPSGSVVPLALEFNWRMFRPYAPGRMMANGARWTTPAVIDDITPNMLLSWAHRDRVLQADQLIGHDDDPIGPEPGTTYTLRILDPVTDQAVRTEIGLVGMSLLYQRAQALHDQGFPSQVVNVPYKFTASRDGFDSWQSYSGMIALHPTAIIESNYQAFDQRVIESPYVVNLYNNAPTPTGNFALAVAARPSDRMVDDYDMAISGGATLAQDAKFTPWVTLDFRLPELETTINVRSSSLYDGVPLDQYSHLPQLGLIDDEIVQVWRIDGKQITITRGCCDTIPAVHLPGSRLWLFEGGHAFDARDQVDGGATEYNLLPGVYGPPVDPATLPLLQVVMSRRSDRPYPPAQVVVNGRPWFEEVQGISGAAIVFSWARRNRVSAGSGIFDHAMGDQIPEVNQTTRLSFYYETPSATPGNPAVRHYLRDISTAGRTISYPYNYAQADGDVAGRALGICGTVVIYCQMFAARDGLDSIQYYVTPIRVPSFPC